MIRVLIADDHAIVRSGISMLINSQEDMCVVATAKEGDEAITKAVDLKPDIVIMDLNMPSGKNGLIATKQLKEQCPDIQIIVLTMHDDKEYIFRVLQAGASGYILKSAEDMDLLTAIRTVYKGDAYLYPKAASVLISTYLDQVASGIIEDGIGKLTPREEEIVSLLAKGYANKEIAEKLFVSVKTIESHKSKIMEKLNLKTRPELVKYALKQGLLDFE